MVPAQGRLFMRACCCCWVSQILPLLPLPPAPRPLLCLPLGSRGPAADQPPAWGAVKPGIPQSPAAAGITVANCGYEAWWGAKSGSPQTTRSFLVQKMAISMQAGPCVVSLYMGPRNMVGVAGKTDNDSGATTANRLDLNPRITPTAALLAQGS